MARSSHLAQRIERLLNESSSARPLPPAAAAPCSPSSLVPAALFASTALVRVEAAAAPMQQASPQAQLHRRNQSKANPRLSKSRSRRLLLPRRQRQREPRSHRRRSPMPHRRHHHPMATSTRNLLHRRRIRKSETCRRCRPCRMSTFKFPRSRFTFTSIPPFALNCRRARGSEAVIATTPTTASPMRWFGDPGSKPRFNGHWDDGDRGAEIEKARKAAHGHFSGSGMKASLTSLTTPRSCPSLRP